MEANNIRDIKEALLKVSAIANFAGMVMSPESAIEEIREILKPISAIHIRNCDVGTVDEQAERFMDFAHLCFQSEVVRCAMNWVQMQYEEGGEK